MMFLPALTFCTIGIRMMVNITDSSHNLLNSGIGKSSWKFRMFINSRSMNGSMTIELMIVGALRFVKMFFIQPALFG